LALEPAVIQTVEKDPNSTPELAFSSDGRTLAFVWYKAIELWDTNSGEVFLTINTPWLLTSPVALLPDGQTLAFGHGNGMFALYNVGSNLDWDLRRPNHSYVSALSFSHSGRLLASGLLDGTVRLWEITPNSLHGALDSCGQVRSRPVWSVAFSPDGQALTALEEDYTGPIVLWNVKMGSRHPLSGLGCYGVALLPDSQMVATNDGLDVQLWDVESGQSRYILQGHAEQVQSIKFSPDGQILASGSRNKSVRLWDSATGAALHTLDGHSGAVNCVTFSPNGKFLASGSNDNTVRL
jgi:WD40 repeat protein